MPLKLTMSELAEERRISLWKVKFDLNDEQVARPPALQKQKKLVCPNKSVQTKAHELIAKRSAFMTNTSPAPRNLKV